MKASEVRAQFLQFFADREHEVVSSSALVPYADPTLMFTNAGMNQFKDVFTGTESRDYKRATTSQKCLRAGGKHNDLDAVGKTPRHHTFFEMLGNFSFGDYFKKEAIAWAWELLTDKLGIDQSRLIITYYGGDTSLPVSADNEARDIWIKAAGVPKDRVIGLGASENFWMMGDTGPMGPCSEIHYYVGEGKPKIPTAQSSEDEWEDWLEVWNLVFMQYERKTSGGELFDLPAPSIDTGAGLERLAAVLQGASSNYDTDLFQSIITETAKMAKVDYGQSDDTDTSLRVIADHARATTFLIADGVFPDKSAREYVLRRIFRRAVRHGKMLGIDEPFMHEVCGAVVNEMEDAYPDLRNRLGVISEVALEEEKRFRSTLDRGLGLLDETFESLQDGGSKTVPGDRVFQLYDTFGFPDDLTEIIAEERGYQIDKDGFRRAMQEAKDRSKFSGASTDQVDEIFKKLASELPATSFTGYSQTSGDCEIIAIIDNGKVVDEVGPGSRVAIACNQSPFYAESGGQVGDTGMLAGEKGAVTVEDTKKFGGDVHFHFGIVTGRLTKGSNMRAQVDEQRRNAIRANHSATHLLHLALKKTLGDHVAQKGSLVDGERLRFDFSHFHPVTDEEKSQIEDWVNEQIRANGASQTDVMALEDAKEKGAVAMFGEKYGDKVRVVQIGHESLEFCGGTHVERSGDIGLLKIVGESGIAQGVRRIEAVTGAAAIDYVRSLESLLTQSANALKTSTHELPIRLSKMRADIKAFEKEIGQLKSKLASGAGTDLTQQVQEINGVSLLATSSEVSDTKALRETGDHLRDKLGSAVILLLGKGQDKVSMVSMVTKDLTDRFHAGDLLKAVASHIDGRGGGKPHLAQGGGTKPAGINAALDAAREYVASKA